VKSRELKIQNNNAICDIYDDFLNYAVKEK
jgi:hypothetical protein